MYELESQIAAEDACVEGRSGLAEEPLRGLLLSGVPFRGERDAVPPGDSGRAAPPRSTLSECAAKAKREPTYRIGVADDDLAADAVGTRRESGEPSRLPRSQAVRARWRER